MKKILIGSGIVMMLALGAMALDWRYDPNNSNATGNTIQMIIDEVSATVTYIGRAKAGTATSAAQWQIYKASVNGTVTTIQFYSGDASYNAVWDGRATATYR
jgi:hypothetical protein